MALKAYRTDVGKAVRFVRRHGGEVETIRLQHFLGDMNLSNAEKTLSKYQFPNGGWFYEDDYAKILSIGASTLWLRTLLELGLANTTTVGRTAAFIMKHQDSDGSWYELKEKLEKAPQAWLNVDEMDNRLWFTMSATVFLTACGFGSALAIKKSCDYISKYWDENRSFRATWWPYWGGVAFFANMRGTSSEAFLLVIPILWNAWNSMMAFT